MLKPLKFKNASQTQSRYMIRLAFVSALYLSLNQAYKDKPGREKLKNEIKDGFEYSQKLFNLANGGFDREELDEIEKRIKTVFDFGFHEADSAQVYISAMIGLISEILTEILNANSKKPSKKIKPLQKVIADLESLYTYFSSRTRQERFDTEGLELMNLINEFFQ